MLTRRYAAGVLVVGPRGRVLLLRRSDGTWGIPGGHAEPEDSENNVLTARRELAEETGYVGPLSWQPGALAVTRWPDGVVYTTLAATSPVEFQPRLDDGEHVGFAWIQPHRPRLPMHRGVPRILLQARRLGILRPGPARW